jgi:hypothetical protein
LPKIGPLGYNELEVWPAYQEVYKGCFQWLDAIAKYFT